MQLSIENCTNPEESQTESQTFSDWGDNVLADVIQIENDYYSNEQSPEIMNGNGQECQIGIHSSATEVIEQSNPMDNYTNNHFMQIESSRNGIEYSELLGNTCAPDVDHACEDSRPHDTCSTDLGVSDTNKKQDQTSLEDSSTLCADVQIGTASSPKRPASVILSPSTPRRESKALKRELEKRGQLTPLAKDLNRLDLDHGDEAIL